MNEFLRSFTVTFIGSTVATVFGAWVAARLDQAFRPPISRGEAAAAQYSRPMRLKVAAYLVHEGMEEMSMKVSARSLALLLVLGIQGPLCAQVTPRETPTRAQIIDAAKAIVQEARYCTLITLGADGQPQARIVDPFPPDSDLTIWIATNPLTRKVEEIRRDPRMTLLCFNPATFEYVTVLGTAVLDTDARHKAAHWKDAWAALYKDQNRGDDYLLLRVTPSRLEVVSARRGMENDPKTWRPVIVDLPK